MSIEHECDLFLFSSHSAYSVNRSLEEFAVKGARNINGWGIGYYIDGKARVVRTNDSALSFGGGISDGFRYSCNVIESKTVLGHLRLSSAGDNRIANNHPFKLNFLGYDWLFIHNGTAQKRDLVTYENQIIFESNSDSPRVFEFLSYRIIDYLSSKPKGSLIEAVRSAFSDLLTVDPNGKFNIIMSNGHITFVLIHWRDFYLYKNEKGNGDTLRLSTLPIDERLNMSYEQLHFNKLQGKKAKMLVINGNSLIFNGDIPK
ncbi:MAG TPA: class II glutamine amidotransferase [Saprospiraceae bacterium]|nr:class II glutamine amidotransferase [Saprospiraceae bacterium]